MWAEGEVPRDNTSRGLHPEGEETRDRRTKMETAVQVTPPEPLDFSCPAERARWARRLERFQTAAALDEKCEEDQVSSLLFAVGEAADDILAVGPLTRAEKRCLELEKLCLSSTMWGNPPSSLKEPSSVPDVTKMEREQNHLLQLDTNWQQTVVLENWKKNSYGPEL
jgi:hypothetical protein